MKYRLAIDDFELNGYTLISPLKGQNPIKIGEYLDDGEAEEIICDNILENIPTENLMVFIRALSSKLKHGGILVFTGTDVMMLVEKYTRGEISIIDFNKILFGLKNYAWAFKLACITLSDINEICEQVGLKVLERKLDGTEFCIKVQRA